MINTGSCGLVDRVVLDVIADARVFAVADLDGDQVKDVVVGSGSGLIQVFMGNDRGQLVAITTLSTGILDPSELLVMDLDQNSNLDLVVASAATSTIATVMARDRGVFNMPTEMGLNASPTHLQSADMNGDLAMDLVVTSTATDQVRVLFQSNGSFPAALTYTLSRPGPVVVFNSNADDFPDLVVVEDKASGARVTVLANDAGMGFTETHVNTGNNGALEAAVADFNGDGPGDIVILARGTPRVLLRYAFGSEVTLPTTGDITHIAVGPLDDDGTPDLVTVDSQANVSLLRNAGGSFTGWSIGTAGTNPSMLRLADVNRDLVPDILVVSRGTTTQGGGDATLTIFLYACQ